MNQNEVLLTKSGLAKLQTELDELKTVRWPDIAERLSAAIEHGDLSENAEYISAKDEQGRIASRIAELEMLINSAQIIDEKKGNTEVVIGATVEIIDFDATSGAGDVEIFQIVGTTEADALHGKISDLCPVGAAILGKMAGANVTVRTPDGSHRIKLVSVNRL